MLKVRVYCWFLLLFVVYSLAAGQNRNLCDICDCSPNTSQPTHVVCNCKKNKIVLLKEEDGDTLLQTQFLNISNCNFLSFPPNGFQKSKKLKTVEIHQMNLFHLNSGTFPALSNLLVEDVHELILDGFQGQNSLSNIDIKKSYLSEISEDTFKTATTLSKLSFTDVTIGTISTASIAFTSANIKPIIQFVNCKIDEIQTDGMNVQVSRLEMVNTTINVIHPTSITVSAVDNINIMRCKMGPLLSPDGLNLKATGINIMDNEFASLPSNILTDISASKDKKINFIGNLIHDIDLGGFLLKSKLDKLNFVKNKIVCDCSPRKTSILKLKDLFPGLLTNETYYDGIIDNNFCNNYGGIYLSEFRRQFLAGSICNDTDENLLKTVYSSEPTEKWLSLLQQTSTEASSKDSGSSFITFDTKLQFICLSLITIKYFLRFNITY